VASFVHSKGGGLAVGRQFFFWNPLENILKHGWAHQSTSVGVELVYKSRISDICGFIKSEMVKKNWICHLFIADFDQTWRNTGTATKSREEAGCTKRKRVPRWKALTAMTSYYHIWELCLITFCRWFQSFTDFPNDFAIDSNHSLISPMISRMIPIIHWLRQWFRH
jgi:hypothetical protein